MVHVAVPEAAAEPVAPPELSKRTVALAVIRRGGPKLLEASVIPGLIFYLCVAFGAIGLGYLSAIGWTYGCVAHRLVRRRAVPMILVLGVIGISIRTVLAVGSGSTFVYFAQPILGTLAMGGFFLVSLFVGRPVIERLAGDFWPVTPEMMRNPRVQSLFRGLTVLWAGVNLSTATLTFVLLRCLPLAAFVAVKQVSGLAISASAVTLTIIWCHRTACREGMVTAAPRRRAGVAPA